MAQAENLDSRLLRSQAEEQAAARQLKEKKRGESDRSNNLALDPVWRARLAEAQKRSQATADFKKNFIGKRIAKKAAEKVAEGSNKIFIALLMIALMIDLLEYLDFGIFSSLVNVGIYALVVTAGFFTWFVKNNNNKFSIFNLLKGQLWKYIIMPLFEMIPLINVLPFWTGTVAMMWLKVSYERKKLTVVNMDNKKVRARYSAPDEYQEVA